MPGSWVGTDWVGDHIAHAVSREEVEVGVVHRAIYAAVRVDSRISARARESWCTERGRDGVALGHRVRVARTELTEDVRIRGVTAKATSPATAAAAE